MRHLQKLYEKYSNKGFAVLGFNAADEQKIAREFLRESGATFPTVLDPSVEALSVGFGGYQMRGVPVSYILDAQHKVVEAWMGYQPGHARALAALKKAGLKLEE
jgi:peroxiredoxin